MPRHPKLVHIELIIDGPDVTPETVRASDLGALIIDYERAILAAAGIDPGGVVVSLIGIDTGSDALTFAMPRKALRGAQRNSRAVQSGNYGRLDPRAHAALAEMSRKAAARDWRVVLKGNSALKLPDAEISKEHPVPPVPEPQAARGTTVVYGELLRVGGEPPAAWLRTMDGDKVNVDLTVEMAKQLAHRLYEQVGIEGEVEWNRADWKIAKFRATRITAYRESPILQAFNELAAAAGNAWDDVDPIEFVRKQRGGRSA